MNTAHSAGSVAIPGALPVGLRLRGVIGV